MSTERTAAATAGPGEFFTTEELAARYRTSPSSIRFWRMNATGPAGVKYGRRVLYSAQAVAEWEAAQAAAEDGDR